MRSRSVFSILAWLFVTIFAAAEPPMLPPDLRSRNTGSDWPAFLGPSGDSISTEKGILAPWPRQGPPLVYQLPLGEGYVMPSISRGRLFVFDRHGDKNRLSCRKSETGELLWKFEYTTRYVDHFGYDGGPRCCPVVDDDHVYIFGPEGMLHCLAVTDGKELWKCNTSAEFSVVQNFFGVGSTPVIEGDLLLVMVGGSPKDAEPFPTLDQKGNGTGIVAFEKRTGKVQYKISDELASYASPVLATIHGRRWCFAFARGGLLAFEPATGKIDFHFPWRARALECVNASNPVVVGDKVLITEAYGPGAALLRVKKHGGYEVVWSDETKRRDKSLQCHWNTPIHHEGYVYGSSGRHLGEAELRCVEWATGKIMWREPELTRASLLMVDGHFICLCEDGMLRLLKVNPQKYEEVSAVHLKDENGRALLKPPCWAAPILSHGLLFVRGENRLVCLELIPPKK